MADKKEEWTKFFSDIKFSENVIQDYVAKFIQHRIHTGILTSINFEDLKDMGIVDYKDQLAIIQHIEKLKNMGMISLKHKGKREEEINRSTSEAKKLISQMSRVKIDANRFKEELNKCTSVVEAAGKAVVFINFLEKELESKKKLAVRGAFCYQVAQLEKELYPKDEARSLDHLKNWSVIMEQNSDPRVVAFKENLRQNDVTDQWFFNVIRHIYECDGTTEAQPTEEDIRAFASLVTPQGGEEEVKVDQEALVKTIKILMQPIQCAEQDEKK